MRRQQSIALGGGVDGTSPETRMPPGRLRIGLNVEAKPGGGYRRILGYSKVDANAITGSGKIRGVHYYDGKFYAWRNSADGLTCSMWSSAGSGWTEEVSGLAPDGEYNAVNYNFDGTLRMYVASGTHKAYQWDGSTKTDITTAYPTDEPDYVWAHRKHLFVSFGPSVQNSAIGDPSSWSVLTGATEILLPDNVTGFTTMSNGSLGIFTRTGVTLLAGTSSSDWVANNLQAYANNAGALPMTIQSIGSRVFFVDSRGVTDFNASDVSSDFYESIISHDMDKVYLRRWVNAVSSTVVRAKNQYRVFFADGSGLIFVFNGNQVMITRTQFPNIVRCCHNGETAAGSELILFGSDDGYVYQMESGNSFTGENINAYAETAFTDLGMRATVKRYHRMWLDVAKNGNSTLTVLPRFFVDNGGLSPGTGEAPDFADPGSLLGSAVLGQAVLGGQPVINGQLDLRGLSEYISLRFYSSDNEADPWELDGYTLEFSPGRRRR